MKRERLAMVFTLRLLAGDLSGLGIEALLSTLNFQSSTIQMTNGTSAFTCLR